MRRDAEAQAGMKVAGNVIYFVCTVLLAVKNEASFSLNHVPTSLLMRISSVMGRTCNVETASK